MIYINIANFVLISQLGKDHSMIKTRHLKKCCYFYPTIIAFLIHNIIKSWLLLIDNQNAFMKIPFPLMKLLRTSQFLHHFLKI